MKYQAIWGSPMHMQQDILCVGGMHLGATVLSASKWQHQERSFMDENYELCRSHELS